MSRSDGPRSTRRCECGHPEAAHPLKGQRARDGYHIEVVTPCRATVYETVDNGPLMSGMNAWPCPCKAFKVPSLGPRSTLKGYDSIEVKQRTCQQCGMLLDNAGEYHPYVFCVLKKAGRDPWPEIRTVALQLGLGDPGAKPPLVRELHS